MEKNEDGELERIKQAKLREMMKRTTLEKRETPLEKTIKMADVTFKETIQNHSLVVVDCWTP
jgi:hypothetical protein